MILYYRMTGVGGRPEVIIEGTNSPNQSSNEWMVRHSIFSNRFYFSNFSKFYIIIY